MCAEDKPPPPEPRDRLLLHSQSETGVRVLRERQGQVELGELRPMREGRPLEGEIVRLAPTDHDRVFDVESVYEAPKARSSSGPAKVTSAAFRAEWDRIFGAPDVPEPEALN